MSEIGGRFKTFGPDAQVWGRAMLGFITAINYRDFETILKHHKLTRIDPEAWYDQQIWLDVFNDIARLPSASSYFIKIGLKLIDNIVIPPEAQTLPFADLMRQAGEIYKMNNRGKDIGSIETEVINDKHLAMHDRTPYPDDFVYGAFYMMALRFLPKHTPFVVKFDERGLRRDKGGAVTIVHIRWS